MVKLCALVRYLGVSSVLLLGGGSALLFAETIEVSLYKMQFVPAQITISKGDTVRWLNQEKRQYHSVWFEQLGDPEAEYFFPEESVTRTFNEAGVFPYRCGPHPKMTGTVIVKEARSASDPKIVDSARQQELTYMVKQDCGSCHGMLLKGGLGPALLPENLKQYSVADISAIILYGRPGTPMPPWKGILSELDANWIANSLKAGVIHQDD